MILVSTDGSELSDKAVVTAAKLAKQLGTEMLVITVVKAKGAEHAIKTLEEAKETAEKLGAKCETEEVVANNTIPEAILKTAQEKHVRFIVMASRGLGTLGSLFIGSTTQQVLAKADRPVLVVR
ncbi:MAG: universal stress protein [Burkholderiales bacterium]|nr:universal stress protein [Burkholderiales bacterium]